MRSILLILLTTVTAYGAAPIRDIKISGSSSQVASGTLTIQSGASLVSASGSTVNLSSGTLTLGPARIPWASVNLTGGAFGGDSGSGGTLGLVPAPASGDAAAGKVLGAGGGWVPVSTTLVGLGDVDVTTPTSGQVLTFNGTDWVNGAPPASSLASLSDVDIASPTNGDVLTFNGSEWIAFAGGGGGGGLIDPTTTKGDIIGRTSSTVSRIPVGADGAALVADSSQALGVRWSTGLYSMAGASAAISVPSGAETYLLLNSTVLDPDGLHNPSTGRITVPVGGIYLLTGHIEYPPHSTGSRNATIMVNRSSTAAINTQGNAGAAFSQVPVFGLRALAPGDYLELRAFHTAGTSLSVGFLQLRVILLAPLP